MGKVFDALIIENEFAVKISLKQKTLLIRFVKFHRKWLESGVKDIVARALVGNEQLVAIPMS